MSILANYVGWKLKFCKYRATLVGIYKFGQFYGRRISDFKVKWGVARRFQKRNERYDQKYAFSSCKYNFGIFLGGPGKPGKLTRNWKLYSLEGNLGNSQAGKKTWKGRRTWRELKKGRFNSTFDNEWELIKNSKWKIRKSKNDLDKKRI